MFTVLFWIYFANAVLIIDHEIESAYWKEWDLFHLPGQITGFVIIHIPVLALILLGGIMLYLQNTYGYILSVVLSAGGIFAFSAHTYFIKKGRPEFTLPISKILLSSILGLSLIQMVLSIYEIIK
jgi:hypothetical protein